MNVEKMEDPTSQAPSMPTAPEQNTLSRILSGLFFWALATSLDWLSPKTKAYLLTAHIGILPLANNGSTNAGFRTYFSRAVFSFATLVAICVLSPPRRLMLCYHVFRLLKSELAPPALHYLQFENSDEENLGGFLQGMVTMTAFSAPVIISAAPNHIAALSTMFAGIVAISTVVLGMSMRYRQRWPLLGHLATAVYHVLRFLADVYNGIIDHKALRMGARRIEAWEARRSKKPSASLPRLAYDSLDESRREIRVLRLRRRTLRSELRCEFVKASVDNPPPFDAISYTWGGEKPTENIIVDGCRLPVTPSVFKFLWYRRSFWSEAYLWIDAICINQESIPERNTQVMLMGDIYRLATRTLIWLAHALDAEDSATARRELMVLAIWNTVHLPSEILGAMLDVNPNISTLVSLFSKSYFSRIWVVQEIALAQKVHVIYGHAILDWDTLARAVMPVINASLLGRVTASSPRPDQVGRHIVNILCISRLRSMCRGGGKPGLRQALAGELELRWFASTDARDKIFGLFGMISDASHSGMPAPDYNETPQKLYVQTGRYLLDQDPASLDILQYAGIGYETTRLKDLPSWVPDWTCQLQGARVTLPYQQPWYLRSSNDAQRVSRVSRVTDALQLEVDAKELDTVLLAAPSICFDPVPPKWKDLNALYIAHLDEITALAASCPAIQSIYSDENELDEAIFNTLVGAAHVSIAQLGSIKTAFGFFQAAKQSMRSTWQHTADEMRQLLRDAGVTIVSDTDMREINDKMWRLFFAIGDSAGKKRFCVLASGRLALCPPRTQERDVVMHLRGATVPFVLRHHPKEAESKIRLKLLGGCFVHGVEDEDKQEDGWKAVYLV